MLPGQSYHLDQQTLHFLGNRSSLLMFGNLSPSDFSGGYSLQVRVCFENRMNRKNNPEINP